jgi:hypothetical protein
VNRYYYSDRFKTDGKTLGPVSIEELEQLYINQEITEKCLVCIEGTEEWHPYVKTLEHHNVLKKDSRKLNKEEESATKERKLKRLLNLYGIGPPLIVWGWLIGVDFILKVIQADVIAMDAGGITLPLGPINIIFLTIISFILIKNFIFWINPKARKESPIKSKVTILNSISAMSALTLITIFALIIGVVLYAIGDAVPDILEGPNLKGTCVVCESDRGYYQDGGFLSKRVIRCKTCDAVK